MNLYRRGIADCGLPLQIAIADCWWVPVPVSNRQLPIGDAVR
jgi:hypothetical protein